MIYPWHEESWTRIAGNRETLHHGVLLTGQSGIGKPEFALALSERLLCQSAGRSSPDSCGQCQSCRLFGSGSHPDFHAITTEQDSAGARYPLLSQYSNRYQDSAQRDRKTRHGRVINIDQVRLLIERFSTFSHISGTKVALIHPADRMNMNTANALLKLLEEPPDNSVLILVTSEPGRLPATIRSRCMGQPLAAPDRESALQWLAQFATAESGKTALHLAGGGPIGAKYLIDQGYLEQHEKYLSGIMGMYNHQTGAIDLAEQLAKLDFEIILKWFQRFVVDLVLWRVAGAEPYWSGQVAGNRKKESVEKLCGLYDKITGYRKISREPLNQQLAIEEMVFAFQRSLA
ncbi:MAG: DNA polymerase III subunit delta' [Gammaproteobacteria bacterium]|nr:DNA polymerase III subunit delta' [Gammaproteobacteria bacterium]